MKLSCVYSVCIFIALSFGCNRHVRITDTSYRGSVNTANYKAGELPPPYATESSKNFSKVTGWPGELTPIAPTQFEVTRFADGFDHPRWIYVADNGDVFVAESNTVLKGIQKVGAKVSRRLHTHHYGTSANKIILFRDKDKDGMYETRTVFLEGLNQPFGMLILKNHFYVGNTDALVMYDYDPAATNIAKAGKKIISLPAGKYNRHWTRNIITNEAKSKIYIAVGSGSNVAENGLDNEINRAAIWEINPDGSNMRIYASGLRNPVGMDWAPGTQTLWAAVNERDELGDELVPDYLTGVKEDAFYGWPYSYYGQHEDPRMKDHKRPDLVARTIVPDVALGSHTASLGLLFYDKKTFPAKYHGGAFISQHGSWNRSVLSGYKVIFIPFKNGKPSGPPEDFLTGFIADLEKAEVHGRPVGLATLPDGSLLISDDASNLIWKVSAKK
jgi:glucose/arabinose dehydrogenase